MCTSIVSRRLCAAAVLASITFAFGPQLARASVISLASWAPVPNPGNNSFPEIAYNTTTGLQTGAGAIGNGDGNLPPTSQTAGGLETDTVVNAPIPFSFASSTFTGGTGYYDTSLTFTGLLPSGTAVQSVISPIGPIIEDSQLLGSGTFTLTSTAPSGSVVLLTGNISGATLVTGVDGGNSGATFNADGVTYTGGIIAAALPNYAILSGNDMSIGMTAVTPAFGINGQTGQLNSFTADATGSFDINLAGSFNSIPEPATFSLLALGVTLSLRRRRRNKI